MPRLTLELVPSSRCEEVRGHLSAYLDGDLPARLHSRVSAHLRLCRDCRRGYAGLRNVVLLLGNERCFELPDGFSQRLRQRLQQSLT
jgi:predicted anti-sigma-YlaC factor YlaD